VPTKGLSRKGPRVTSWCGAWSAYAGWRSLIGSTRPTGGRPLAGGHPRARGDRLQRPPSHAARSAANEDIGRPPKRRGSLGRKSGAFQLPWPREAEPPRRRLRVSWPRCACRRTARHPGDHVTAVSGADRRASRTRRRTTSRAPGRTRRRGRGRHDRQTTSPQRQPASSYRPMPRAARRSTERRHTCSGGGSLSRE